MSNSDNPQVVALEKLEQVLGSLTEELASWRRRALRAEAAAGDAGASGAAGGNGDGGGDEPPEELLDKLASLESQNRDLNERVSTARERVDGLLMRLHFLEEQVTED